MFVDLSVHQNLYLMYTILILVLVFHIVKYKTKCKVHNWIVINQHSVRKHCTKRAADEFL